MRGLESLSFIVIYHQLAFMLFVQTQTHSPTHKVIHTVTRAHCWSASLSEATERSASHRAHSVDKTPCG